MLDFKQNVRATSKIPQRKTTFGEQESEKDRLGGWRAYQTIKLIAFVFNFEWKWVVVFPFENVEMGIN